MLITNLIKCIKTQGCVLAAKKNVQCTSVLFTGTTKSPFSTPHISITTNLISIKFTYYMPSIYTCETAIMHLLNYTEAL